MSFFRRPSISGSEDDSGGDMDPEASTATGEAEYKLSDDTPELGLEHSSISWQREPNSNFHALSNEVRKATRLSISNRLHSIVHDSLFVGQVAQAYGLPAVANERCGSWYIPQSQKAGSCYFKSTDGHFGQWRFSCRRLNFVLLDIIEKYKGCIIVDSTRRGKSMPDALSKTIPTWCAVLNEVLFPEQTFARKIYLPPEVVSSSEVAQIESRLAGFVKDFKALDLDLKALRKRLSLPIRPIWCTPSSSLPLEKPDYKEFRPVILTSCSQHIRNKKEEEEASINSLGQTYTYIQGAGDDHEGWSCGLDPVAFWKNKNILLETEEHALPEIIRKTLNGQGGTSHGQLANHDSQSLSRLSKVNGLIAVSDTETAVQLMKASNPEFEGILICTPYTALTDILQKEQKGIKILQLSLPSGKNGSKILRGALTQVVDFAAGILPARKLLIVDHTGNDFAIGVALALLCFFFDDEGGRHDKKGMHTVDKALVRRRLSWIVSERLQANPSRSTLQAVNSFLMSPER